MAGITTLELLDREIRGTDPDTLDILLDPSDWMTVAQNVSPAFFVMGTEDRPPLFWYSGRRIFPRGPWRR